MIIGAQNPPAILTDWPRPAEKDIRTVGRPMLYVVTKAYQLHVFFKPCQFKLSREFKAFKHRTQKSTIRCAHRAASHRQHANTETSSPSLTFPPPAPERTNSPHQFKHTNTKRRVIQHLRTVFSAHSAHGMSRLKPLNNELSFASSCF